MQIIPKLCVDLPVANSKFMGFLSRAVKLCSNQVLQDELDFLADNLTENGHDREQL